MLHKDIELRDLLIILIHLLVIGIQLGLGFRSHNLDGLWVVHVTHKRNVLVVGKKRHRAFSAFHLQGIKNLRVVDGCCQHGLVVVDDSRVDGNRLVVDKLLQVNGFSIGIGQADIDLKAIGTLVAGGQAKRECKQEKQVFFHCDSVVYVYSLFFSDLKMNMIIMIRKMETGTLSRMRNKTCPKSLKLNDSRKNNAKWWMSTKNSV